MGSSILNSILTSLRSISTGCEQDVLITFQVTGGGS